METLFKSRPRDRVSGLILSVNLDKMIEFYIYTPTGESLLVELFVQLGVVTMIVGGRRIDMERNSALELADNLLLTICDADT